MKTVFQPSASVVGLLFLLLLILTFSLIFHALSVPQNSRQLAAGNGANITIDYTAVIRTLDPIAIGMDISGYQTPNVFANDTVEQQKLKTLGLTYMRMDLHYATPGDPTSAIICGGNGCMTSLPGDQWITQIKAIGAQPVVIVPLTSSVDASNLVKHFNKDTNNAVHYWIIGNEPDINGVSAQSYSTYFNQDYDAMKAVDPTILVGGATTAWYDSSFIQTFLQQSGSRVDFVDFHGYPQQGTTPGNTTTLFQHATGYGTDITSLRSLIQSVVPTRANQIGIEVGEWELNWGGSAQDYLNFHAVWVADTLGNILQAGGESLFYADKGNAIFMNSHTLTDSLGRTYSVNPDDTNPAYHGIGMFTGEGLFQKFGMTMVHATTTLPNIDVFASDAQKDIVVINKDPSIAQSGVFFLQGVSSGSVDVWRKDESISPQNPPVQLGTVALQNSSFSYTLPPFSVTTFVLASSSVTSTPTLTSPPESTPTVPIPTPTLLPATGVVSPSQSASPTDSVSLTQTPIPTLSVTAPSGSSTPSLTPVPSYSVSPGSLIGSLSVEFEGVGQNGSTPHHTQRSVTLYFYLSQLFTQPAAYQLTTTLSRNLSAPFVFSNPTINLASIPVGSYFVLVKSPEGSLREEVSPTQITLIPGQMTILGPQTTGTQPIILRMGDLNNDNTIDLADYNILIDCYGVKEVSIACSAHHLSDAFVSNFADMGDTGMVDGGDYNLLLRNFQANGY